MQRNIETSMEMKEKDREGGEEGRKKDGQRSEKERRCKKKIEGKKRRGR